MSSRFVSAGAIDPTTGEAAPEQEQRPASNTTAGPDVPKPNDEWVAVEKELAAERRRRDEAKAAAAAGQEKSLFEILEANKAAKQAAFEEANKIKNQFRALDEDEIDFLDEVKAKQRAEEARLRRETEEGLEAFRAAQQRKEGGGPEEAEEGSGEEWIASIRRKRKRARGQGIGVLKKRTTGEGGGKQEVARRSSGGETAAKIEAEEKDSRVDKVANVAEKAGAVAKPKMGLVSYGSDDESD